MQRKKKFCLLPFAFCLDSGFTLIELLVTVAIFIFMTALVVANYGSFNDGTLLTSMSYDVALALRGAQSYGLNVKGATVSLAQNFNYPYGMDFNIGAQNQMIFFADSSSNGDGTFGNGICTGGSGKPCATDQTAGSDSIITTYTLARGGLIKCLNVLNVAPPSSNPCDTIKEYKHC